MEDMLKDNTEWIVDEYTVYNNIKLLLKTCVTNIYDTLDH